MIDKLPLPRPEHHIDCAYTRRQTLPNHTATRYVDPLRGSLAGGGLAPGFSCNFGDLPNVSKVGAGIVDQSDRTSHQRSPLPFALPVNHLNISPFAVFE